MMRSIHKSTQDYIRENQLFEPNYSDRLTNHLSMGLIALDLNGASEQQISQFYHHYSTRLTTLKTISSSNSNLSFSCREYYQAYCEHYRIQIERNGLEDTLKLSLNQLIPGIAAAAFHALIRLSYALQSQSNDEVACALAYWASEYLPIGEIETTNVYRASQHLALAAKSFEDYEFRPGIIIDRITQVKEDVAFNPVRFVPSTLDELEIAQLTISYYLESDNFTLLHGVTAFEALLSLKPFLSDYPLTLQYFWQAYVVAFSTTHTSTKTSLILSSPIQSNTIPTLSHQSIPSWEDLTKASTYSKDDHTIKLAYSCRQLAQQFHIPEYKQSIEMRLQKENLL